MIKGDNKRDNEKDKKDEEKDVIKLVFVVIVSGLVLMGISILFEKGTELHFIIRGLGISIIGGALIAWAVGHLLAKRSFLKIFKDMDAINKNIGKSFKLIKESEDNGLLKIYEPFDMELEKRGPSEFDNDINEFLLKEKNEIKIYGISLRLFFNNLVKFWPQMSNAFDRMNDNKVKIKILLISPYSDWTTQREDAEKDFCSKIRQELRISINWLKTKLVNYDKRDEMYDNIRFYTAATPDSFLFITSECVIFEIYHTGISQLKRDGEIHKGVQDLGLGGHVPAFKFDNSSPMYKYLDAHFDYFFAKEIDGEPNKYHDGTLRDMLERLKKEPIKKASSE